MKILDPDDLVLVALINNPADLEIARVLGWYRIPLQTAPKTVRVNWLGFFLSAAFDEDKWSLRYIAPVLGHEMVRRRELLRGEVDHPRHDEPYYKLILGPLQTLSNPVPSRRWRRFSFLYTNGERLLAARDLTDLSLPAALKRGLLW
jgi:hypothetical protein